MRDSLSSFTPIQPRTHQVKVLFIVQRWFLGGRGRDRRTLLTRQAWDRVCIVRARLDLNIYILFVSSFFPFFIKCCWQVLYLFVASLQPKLFQLEDKEIVIGCKIRGRNAEPQIKPSSPTAVNTLSSVYNLLPRFLGQTPPFDKKSLVLVDGSHEAVSNGVHITYFYGQAEFSPHCVHEFTKYIIM